MPKALPVALALVLGGASLSATGPARAVDADRALLSTFCDAADIKGSTCKRAKGYPNAGRRACNVALGEERYSGKFLASGNALLIVFYGSDCEAPDNGGTIVFEQTGGTYRFRSFQPGTQGSQCVTLPNNKQQDLLICLTGGMGQGILESGVTQMVFKEDARRRIDISPDALLSAEDSTGAHGYNVVTCKEPLKVFDISKLSVGPRPKTMTVEATYADAATIATACGDGFPKPQETFGYLAPGDAYLPDGHEKSGKLTLDIVTRKVTPQN